MDMDLYNVCNEYCKCFETVMLLNSINGVKDNQRLKLYRLLLGKMTDLEGALVKIVVENEIK